MRSVDRIFGRHFGANGRGERGADVARHDAERATDAREESGRVTMGDNHYAPDEIIVAVCSFHTVEHVQGKIVVKAGS